MTKPHEDPALLAELFTYDPATGRVFHARDKHAGRGRIMARAGDYADTTDTKGHRRVSVTVDGKQRLLLAHRVAWILTHGTIPAGLQIDHINCVRDDNRLVNLRLVTCQENHHNRHTAKGYYWNSREGKWQAQIKVDGRSRSLGYHATEAAARSAYLAAKRVYHPSAPTGLYQ